MEMLCGVSTYRDFVIVFFYFGKLLIINLIGFKYGYKESHVLEEYLVRWE